MRELQRQEYLTAMGIDLYFPRNALSSAKSSPHYDIPLDSPESPGKKPAELLNPQPRPAQRSRFESESRGKPGSRSSPAVPKLSPVTADESSAALSASNNNKLTSTDAAGKLQLKLRYLGINKDLAVLEEQPYLHSEADNSSLLLLKSILGAMKVDYSQCSFKAESFNWPVAENLRLAAGTQRSEPEQARLALNGFLRRRFEQDGFKNLLIFSAQLDSLFAPVNENPVCGTSFTGLDFQVTVTKSLGAMLRVPALKKQVWQDLQALTVSLNANR